jgi:DNA mismatch repair protein MutL
MKRLFMRLYRQRSACTAQFSITPTLDFELNASIQSLDSIQKPFTDDSAVHNGQPPFFNLYEANQAHKVGPGSSELSTGVSTKQQKGMCKAQKKIRPNKTAGKGLQVLHAGFSRPEKLELTQLFSPTSCRFG